MKIPEIGKFKFNQEYGIYRGPFIKEPKLGITYRFVIFEHEPDNDNCDLARAMLNFKSIGADIIISSAPAIFEFYQDIKEEIPKDLGYTQKFPIVENSKDIFKTFKFLKDVDVMRDDLSKKVYIKVTASWVWNDNNGYWLGIILEDGCRVNRISQPDGHLTNSGAYGCNSFDDVVYVKHKYIPSAYKPKYPPIYVSSL